MDFNSRFILLDAARLEHHMEKAKELNPNHSSLYKGRSEEYLADVAPYLFTVSDTRFFDWYIEFGWGNAWGVVVLAYAAFEETYRHFRKFLIVDTEDGQRLYFRFYDPRVLKTFLLSCNRGQVIEFFGPIESFIVEGDTKEEAVRFWQQNGDLKHEVMPVEVASKSVLVP